ncbi:MAG: DUF3108 domain-containing protein [Bacteroidales bacterium]|nr:DUF3108 domain-containing protein [Bacteroidales bacterium]
MKHFFSALNFVVWACFVSLSLHGQENSHTCGKKNNTFAYGEELTYIISYNWFVVFSEVGQVTFKIEKEKIFGTDAVHFYGIGSSFSWWDKFFKVRDRYEVWVREDNLRPLFFQRNNREGNFRQHESYTYSGDSLIFRKNKINDKPLKYDTLKINACTWDVLSALLYTRNFDYVNYKIGEKIPITVALDEESYDLYFRYQGLENVKLKDMGTFECMKFTVMLVEGTIFHGGEDLSIWVTNDKNRIPVYVESPILVGNIRARITNIKNNRYPLTSKKK